MRLNIDVWVHLCDDVKFERPRSELSFIFRWQYKHAEQIHNFDL